MTVCIRINMQIYISEYMHIEVRICMCVCENAYLYMTLSFTRLFFLSILKYNDCVKENSHVRQAWTPLLCLVPECM